MPHLMLHNVRPHAASDGALPHLTVHLLYIALCLSITYIIGVMLIMNAHCGFFSVFFAYNQQHMVADTSSICQQRAGSV